MKLYRGTNPKKTYIYIRSFNFSKLLKNKRVHTKGIFFNADRFADLFYN